MSKALVGGLVTVVALAMVPVGGQAHGSDASLTVAVTTPGLVRDVDHGEYRTFDGIPYAGPPVDDLRWRDPPPARPWPGIRDASYWTRFARTGDPNGENLDGGLHSGFQDSPGGSQDSPGDFQDSTPAAIWPRFTDRDSLGGSLSPGDSRVTGQFAAEPELAQSVSA